MIAYVTEDGNYGGDKVLTFDSDNLTDAQWERVADMNDNDRLPQSHNMKWKTNDRH
jgi:hypothetical protein